MPGTLRAIFICPIAGAPPTLLNRVVALPDRGLAGDRYAAGVGSFSRWPGTGRAVSLIEQEAIDAILCETGLDLSGGRHRRNLVTQGESLAGLVGRRFRIGGVLFRGERLCLPCRHLARLTEPGVYVAMKGRGGLRADVLVEGELHVGDPLLELADGRCQGTLSP